MRERLTRRAAVLGGLAAAACAPKVYGQPSPPSLPDGDMPRLPAMVTPSRLAELERQLGGRIGVFALNTANEATIGYRADERFAMASTFKWILAAAMLKRAQDGGPPLSQRLPYAQSDMLEYAPVTLAHLSEGAMSIEDLCAAAVEVSDNTAANVLLHNFNGPPALTRFIRANGDTVTRLDRDEPSMSENAPGDERDTTSGRAMVGLMRTILLGDTLNADNRAKLIGWMERCTTGQNRLRAGLPANWRAGDKTGSGFHGATNDLAIAWPPNKPPILIACFVNVDNPSRAAAREAACADIGRLIAATWS